MGEPENPDTHRSPASVGSVGRAGLIFGAAHIVGLGVALALVIVT